MRPGRPGWTVAEANRALYATEGLALLRERLAPGGALTIWSASSLDEFAATLARTFSRVERLEVDVPTGEPDVIYAAWRD